MGVYLVERKLPELRIEHLAAVHRALTESTRRLAASGERVRYVRSTFVPGRGRLICLFAADSCDQVRKANELAQVPFVAIDEAIDCSFSG